jgi:hypothetical protein
VSFFFVGDIYDRSVITMAVSNSNVFVVKDRIESLEARIERALDEAGLREFSKEVARDALQGVVSEVQDIIKQQAEAHVALVKAEQVALSEGVNSKISMTASAVEQALSNRIVVLEARLGLAEARLRMVAGIAIAAAALAVIL